VQDVEVVDARGARASETTTTTTTTTDDDDDGDGGGVDDDGSSARSSAAMHTRVALVIDAFDALTREEQIAVLREALTARGESETRRSANDERARAIDANASADFARAPGIAIAKDDDDGDAATMRAAALDAKEFGDAARASEAKTTEALAEKWKEVFGEDPPERGNGGLEDIMNDSDERAGAWGVFERFGAEAARASYVFERAFGNLVYRFGRPGAIVASGFVSASVMIGIGALLGASSSENGKKVARDDGDDDASPASADDLAPSSVVDADDFKSKSAKAASMERRVDASVARLPVATGSGVLWTRKMDKDAAPRTSARERMGPPSSGTFDDRTRPEAPKQVLWRRKNDPELAELIASNEYEEYDDVDSDDVPAARAQRFAARRSSTPVSLDDNLEDLRAFRGRGSSAGDPR